MRHFGHWNISVICLTVVSKLAKKVFFSLYFQTFWPKWLNFFRSFQNVPGYDRIKTTLDINLYVTFVKHLSSPVSTASILACSAEVTVEASCLNFICDTGLGTLNTAAIRSLSLVSLYSRPAPLFSHCTGCKVGARKGGMTTTKLGAAPWT